MPESRPTAFANWWIWVLLPLLGWWTYGLFDLDEGFYAAVTGEMIRRGEWITPYYNGQPWFEKPILLYWLAKPAVMAFGSMVGPRLPAVLAQLGICALVAVHVGRVKGWNMGRAAALAAGTTLILVALGRMMLTDSVLILSLTGAFLSFYRSIESPHDALRHRLISALWLGISVLAKGPVGLILFAFAIGWFAAVRRDDRPAIAGKLGHWLLGTVVLAGVVALWYVPSLMANRELFVQKFLIEQNIGRFTGGDAAHAVQFGVGLLIYPAVLAIGTLPWWPAAFRTRALRQSDRFVHFCWVWGATIFWFFMASGSKLPHYVAPACVPIAILGGCWAMEKLGDIKFVRRAAMTSICLFLLCNLGGYGYYHGWFGGAAHSEIHDAIRAVPAGQPIVTFQITRRDKALGTGSLKVQETSHPSLAFYANQTVADVESPDELRALPAGTYVLTRTDRNTVGLPLEWVREGKTFRLGIIRKP